MAEDKEKQDLEGSKKDNTAAEVSKTGLDRRRNTTIAILAIVVLLVIGGLVTAGKIVHRTIFRKRIGEEMMAPRFNMMQRDFGGRGMRGGFGLKDSLTGKVTTVDDKKFTIDASGDTKTVQISDSTRFPLDSATSVKVGDQVLVRGEQDSNGTIQATQIIVNPSNLK